MNALTDYDLPMLEAQLPRWGIKAIHAARLLRAFYDASGRIDYPALAANRLSQTTLQTLERELPPRQSENCGATLLCVMERSKLLVGFACGKRG